MTPANTVDSHPRPRRSSGAIGRPISTDYLPTHLATDDLDPAPAHDGLDYAGVVRAPGHAWWRPLLTLPLLLAIWMACSLLLALAFSVAGPLFGESWDWWLDRITTDLIGPVGFLFNNLFLFALLPSVVLSTWICQRIGIGFTHSVTGRWRWKWFGQVTLVLLPLWLVYGLLHLLVNPVAEVTPHPQLVTMLVIVWLTTPLQCAGEEYAFRGWFLQNIGGLFANRIAAWVVPTVLSSALFAMAHQSLDPWIIADLTIFAIGVSVMTWRTGGLEAAVALHALNNMILMHFGLFAGGFADSIIDETTTGSPMAAAVSLVAQAAAVALVWWWAKRRGVQQYTTTSPRPNYRPRKPVEEPAPPHPTAAWQPLRALPTRSTQDSDEREDGQDDRSSDPDPEDVPRHT